MAPGSPDASAVLSTRFIDTTVWSAFALVGLQLVLTILLVGIAAVAVRAKADLLATAPPRRPSSTADTRWRWPGACY